MKLSFFNLILPKNIVFRNIGRCHASDGFVLFSVVVGMLSTLLVVGWMIIPNSGQFYGRAVHRVKTKEKIVALTFDDGPNPPFTNQILDVLKKYDVKATFFVVGARCKQFPDVVKQVYKSGHELGNHTWSHNILILKSSKFIYNEIDSTDKFLRDLGYADIIYFRSPKGMKFIRLANILAKTNRDNILFDVVGWDWSCPGIEKIVKNVISSVHAGSIILLHDGNGDNNYVITDRSQTVAATEIIIQRLKAKGYRFVTISELLQNGDVR